jgi:polyketide biosynthesis acyl carrier protein
VERDEIMAVVIKHLKRHVDGLEGEEIDPERSASDYQANSLDMVEVVSASMRELQIKVRRTELARLKNLNELVDLFLEAKRRSIVKPPGANNEG